MNTAKAKQVLKKLAAQKGISEAEIRHEIEIAVEEASKSQEVRSQVFWKSVSREGRLPTPEDVSAYIAELLAE